MKNTHEILCEIYESYGDDLQLNITLNPSVTLIKQAMEIYADQFKVKNLAQPDVSGMCDFLMWVTNSSYVWHTGEERWTNGYEYISVEQLQEKWQKQKSHFH